MADVAGQIGLTDGNDLFHVMKFLIDQAFRVKRGGQLVKIVAVHGGGVGPAPTVDVLPLVNQVDGIGTSTPHGVVYGILTTRNQGGLGAVINDPKVDDIGFITTADRDISTVKSTAAQGNPGSSRTHSLSDAVYHGATVNMGTPNQYVQFTATGFRIVDQNGNTIVTDGSGVTITATTLTVNGKIVATGTITGSNVIASSVSVDLASHVHSGISPGGANTAVPVPGT